MNGVYRELANLDSLIFSWINSGMSCRVLDETMPLITHLGAWWVGTGVIIAVVLWRRSRPSLLAGLAYGVAGGTSMGLKLVVERTRPALLPGTIVRYRPPTGLGESLFPWAQGSFPSGHTAAAFAAATLIAHHWPRYGPLAYGLAGAVGFSRIYLGVHYPTDVLASVALGIGITKLILGNRMLRRNILGKET